MRRTREDVCAEFVSIAAQHFADSGYAATSLEEVAAEAGYSKSALLYYFGSKEELLAAVVVELIDEADRVLSQLDRYPPGAERNQAAIDAMVALALDRRPLVSLAMGPSEELSSGLVSQPAIVERMQQTRARFRLMLVGSDSTPAQRVRLAMAFYGLPPALHEFADLPASQLHELLADVLFEAINPTLTKEAR